MRLTVPSESQTSPPPPSVESRRSARQERHSGLASTLLEALALAALTSRGRFLWGGEIARALDLLQVQIGRHQIRRTALRLGLTVSRSGRRIHKGPELVAAYLAIRTPQSPLQGTAYLRRDVEIGPARVSVETFREMVRTACRALSRTGGSIKFAPVANGLRTRLGMTEFHLGERRGRVEEQHTLSGRMIAARLRDLGLHLHRSGGRMWITADEALAALLHPPRTPVP